ncbi:response regulator transcription factor [Fulvivirgaceae bacterium BMA12]|uniref:Response regulator transcription factor n=1 Tax=Agaribacillus aureus TaxID=3051825 RepID=A0ABT8LDK2_9BACT|nr:response regulator transcription factor [Fulvivirgaceae bacterium BMA12]
MNLSIKLLIADDHEMIRDALKALLLKTNSVTVEAEASNGREVLDILNNHTTDCDVVLMDISMPEMNGIEATRLIAKHHPSVKVLALTMYDEQDFINEMFKAGALGFLSKLTTQKTLLEAIETVYRGNIFIEDPRRS